MRSIPLCDMSSYHYYSKNNLLGCHFFYFGKVDEDRVHPPQLIAFDLL